MRKNTIFSLLIFLALIPLTVLLGAKLPGRGFYLTGTVIMIEIMIPFFLAFEGRKPQARELVIIAVLCAVSIASRVAIPIPHFKATFAVIMLSAVAFGPETGFLVGAITAFASNFFLGQGPYTPWQMMAYGAGGLLTGFLARKKWLSRNPWELAFFAFFASVLWVGPLLDCSTVFLTLSTITLPGVLAILGTGMPVNLGQGVCSFLTMVLISRPLLAKLDRIQRKYGMLDPAADR